MQAEKLTFDVAIIGAGAAGLMCAITAGQRGRRVVLIDHAQTIGEKIRISGGGRCNFTNIHTKPENFLSENPRFCISALHRYTPSDFCALVERHGIAWHEKTLGQLFCDGPATQIVTMLLDECRDAGVTLHAGTKVGEVAKSATGFEIASDKGPISTKHLVIATGGLSIPKIGATGFGYAVAEQFGLAVVPPRPALVPLIFAPLQLTELKDLSGIAVDSRVRFGKTTFDEALLFTHRGLSGPAILQISSYWRDGQPIHIDMAPGRDVFAILRQVKIDGSRQKLHTALSQIVPKRLAQKLSDRIDLDNRNLADLSDGMLRTAATALNDWQVVPAGTEGYRTAEVTAGGIDTKGLSSQTMEARDVPGLFFIGEVVDVTGHLGGYNFQWAWASGVAAGKVV
jgi:predicted Rossmann fold flavoprotein